MSKPGLIVYGVDKTVSISVAILSKTLYYILKPLYTNDKKKKSEKQIGISRKIILTFLIESIH